MVLGLNENRTNSNPTNITLTSKGISKLRVPRYELSITCLDQVKGIQSCVCPQKSLCLCTWLRGHNRAKVFDEPAIEKCRTMKGSNLHNSNPRGLTLDIINLELDSLILVLSLEITQLRKIIWGEIGWHFSSLVYNASNLKI